MKISSYYKAVLILTKVAVQLSLNIGVGLLLYMLMYSVCVFNLGERLFPSSQFEGITDDDISSQVTDDSLPYPLDLSSLDNNGESGAESLGKTY